jgi:mono/diheme cytochrome c family protein
MIPMKTRLSVLLFGLLTTVPFAAETAPAPAALLERGRYLVEGVGLCADCHTPRNEKGEFVTAHWLRGAPIGFAPAMPMPWAPVAPPIAGLPSMTAEQAVAFLMQGKRPDGTMPRPPMPPYRLNEEDARAMVAYLKSIGDAPAQVASVKH